MHNTGDLFADIVIIFVAAFLGGFIARVARLPILLGYLTVGVLIGPHVLRIISNVETVHTLAEFGVILLLFAVGVEISFRDLRKLGNVVVFGSLGQIAASAAAGFGLGQLLGWSVAQSIVFGFVISLSSTMVVLKTLTDRGELLSVHGRVLTGVLLVQDLAFVPMIAVFPALTSEGGSPLADLGLGALKAVAVLGLTIFLGLKLTPKLLYRVFALESREIFLLTIVALTFATAALTSWAGLSAALGAFVVGLVLSESDFGRHALMEIIPLRDTFASLFFVSLGMLTDPMFLFQNPGLVLLVVTTVIGIKFFLTTGLIRAFGFLPQTALLVGFGLGQVGEFSFILAGAAVTLGIAGQDFLTLVVVSAVITMSATPWIIDLGARSVGRLGRRFELLRPSMLLKGASSYTETPFYDHVVLCGLGRTGVLVAGVLTEQKVPLIGIDLDPRTVTRFRDQGHVVIHGSCAEEAVLRAAHVESAKLLLISTGDPVSAQVTAQRALAINPKLDIVARVRWREEGERLLRAGVGEVVWPEMEAGIEILRHSLRSYRVDRRVTNRVLAELRKDLAFGHIEESLPAEGLGEEHLLAEQTHEATSENQ